MLINFNEIQERTVPGMNHGTGEMTAECTWEKTERSSPAVFMPEDQSAVIKL